MEEGQLPTISVIIPTLNASRTLNRCLSSIRSQDYSGKIEVIIVDGGSSDETLKISKQYPGIRVIVRSGKNIHESLKLGIMEAKGDLIWKVDSDNYIYGRNTAFDLVIPFLEISDLDISIPLVTLSEEMTPLDKWLTSLELYNINHLIKNKCKKYGDYLITDPLGFGITNASMINRKSIILGSENFNDFLMLRDMQLAGHAKSALVEGAMYIHDQGLTLSTYLKKWLRRSKYYSDNNQLSYLLKQNLKLEKMDNLTHPIRTALFSVIMFIRTRQIFWLYGLINVFLISFIFVYVKLIRLFTKRRILRVTQ